MLRTYYSILLRLRKGEKLLLQFALITARHLGFDHAEPRLGAIFMRLVFCHGRPFSNPPSRGSIRCNIHEVSLLSRPAIFESTKQRLDPVQYSWGLSFVTAGHLGFLHVEPRSGAIFMRRWRIRDLKRTQYNTLISILRKGLLRIN